ncbi:MAG: hypothetical protein A2103_03760 [Gammaproteobacteria bacterium GWF2_41_13]|nr:MAG: hypothetical protein A2103_03760 [Gammaproteobacteria bacterium GWF2_41_13]
MLNYQSAASTQNQSALQSIDTNLKFIEELALQYIHQTSLPKAQLMMIGRTALVRAIEHFNIDRGLTFDAHATWWIKQSIEKEILVKQIGSITPHSEG